MIIKKVTKKDSLEIRQWRNDKRSIFYSKSKKKVTLETHSKWFEKTLNDKKIKFYIGYLVKKKLKKKSRSCQI